MFCPSEGKIFVLNAQLDLKHFVLNAQLDLKLAH